MKQDAVYKNSFEWIKSILLVLTKHKLVLLEIVIFGITAYLSYTVNLSNRKEIWEYIERDIYWEYYQSMSIWEGENPYEKVLQYDLLTNHKYADKLPLNYIYLTLISFIGAPGFEGFMDAYRAQLNIIILVCSVFIYLIFRRQNLKLLGFLAASFFLFNRWTLNNVMDAKQDVVALTFLLASLYLITSINKKTRMVSFLVYGIAVGIKHISVFAAPIFLLPLINKEFTFKEYVKAGLLFLIPTLGASLFLITKNPSGFIHSMLFSFTREPSKSNTEFGYRNLLILYDVGVKNNSVFFYILPRLPLFIFSGLNAVLLWLRKIPVFVYVLTSFTIFIAFNPVLFNQYYTWLTPLIFLPAVEIISGWNYWTKKGK